MPNAMPIVTSWTDAILLALTGALSEVMSFIPKLIGALVILLVGWIIASVVSKIVVRALRVVRFNQVADRAEIDTFLHNAGVQMDPAAVVGKLAYWFLLLIFVGAAFSAFGLPQVTDIVGRILAFIPNVVVAMVVLLLGALAATFVSNLVRGAAGTSHLGDPNLIAGLARGAVLVFAALIALDQLNIAPAILNTLWMALLGMFALAGALAFGLGGRDVAKRMLEDWYSRRGQVANLAGAMTEQARSASSAGAAPRPVTSATPSPERADTTRRAA
jgi:hypothetical protein